jgi:hypothetical protein
MVITSAKLFQKIFRGLKVKETIKVMVYNVDFYTFDL